MLLIKQVAIIFEIMMMKKYSLLFLIFCASFFYVNAQEGLPNFQVKEIGKGKVQIHWYNKFPNIVQITVQRSFDSTKYFRSIFSSLSPSLPESGFLDKNVPIGYKVFYRILYVFEGGEYFFTKSQSPGNQKSVIDISDNSDNTNEDKTNENKFIKIYKPTKENLLTTISYKDYKRFRDSIYRNTKDTIRLTENDDEVIIRPYVAKVAWKASAFIYTNDKGYLRINLPLAKQKKYSIVFYNESEAEVLRIRHIKETSLLLDKSNFQKSGWYFFDLFEDDKLKERNKFFLGKDRL